MEQIGNVHIDYQRLAEAIVIASGNFCPNSISVEQFREEYEKFIERNRSKAYLSSVGLSFDHLLKYFSPARMVNSISFKDAEAFMSDLLKRCPKGCYVYYRTLKAAFNKGIEWNYLHSNPFLKIRLPKKQEVKPAYIQRDILDRIQEKMTQQFIKDISEICFYSGLRLGEAVNLRWEDLDSNNKVMMIGNNEHNSKSRKQRSVPLHPKIQVIINRKRELLRSKKQEARAYLFEKVKNVPYSTDYVSKSFKKACRAAGIEENIHFHSLRHSTASLLVQGGKSLYVVQNILGHASINTTQIYAHLQLETLREAIDSL